MVRAGGDGPWQGLSCWHGSRSCLAARRRRRPQASDRRPGARGGPRQHLIEKLRGELARLKRARFGTSSEKLGTRLEQLELAIEALEVDEAERLAGTPAVAEAREAARLKPARRDLPAHLPRESVVHAGPCACPACGGSLRRIGEDVTESLDYVPGRFKVVRHVREAFACRACEQVVQAPAPHHAVPRGRAGPGSWPTSRWRSSTTIFRCIARPRSTRATASIWRPRRSRAGSARLRPRCSR